MLFHRDVVIRMTPEQAELEGYPVVSHVQIHDSSVPGEFKDMVYCKSSLTNVPFFKGNQFDYRDLVNFLGITAKNWIWIVFIPITIIIITGVSNGSNLTDGLDGLATGTSAIIALALAILAYVSGNTIMADYLNIFYIPYSGELVIFSACFLGPVLDSCGIIHIPPKCLWEIQEA
jgi:phospho-N-acetylmuramoyl-pentapeptide-transferase